MRRVHNSAMSEYPKIFVGPREDIEKTLRGFLNMVPHNKALGMKLVDFRDDHEGLTLAIPFREELVGNPEWGILSAISPNPLS